MSTRRYEWCDYCGESKMFNQYGNCTECGCSTDMSKEEYEEEQEALEKDNAIRLKRMQLAKDMGYSGFVVTPDNLNEWIEHQIKGIAKEDRAHVMVMIQATANSYITKIVDVVMDLEQAVEKLDEVTKELDAVQAALQNDYKKLPSIDEVERSR